VRASKNLVGPGHPRASAHHCTQEVGGLLEIELGAKRLDKTVNSFVYLGCSLAE